MNANRDWVLKGTAMLVSGLMLSACSIKPEPLTSQQLMDQWAEDSSAMFSDVETLPAKLSFSAAVARTFNYNLDKRAKTIEESLALERVGLVSYDELPKLVASADHVLRSNNMASTSQDMSTGTIGSPSFSTDRNQTTASLGLTWNVLDFGLSYYQAKTAMDRALITIEHRRKAEQALIADVRATFWRAAANQVLAGPIRSILAEAQKALRDSKAVEAENLKSPAEALQFQKSLLETTRQMTAIQQQLSSAPYELAALVNVDPGHPVKVVVPSRLAVPRWSMPVEKMTELAFINNPDIHEQAYLARIAANEAKSDLLEALPGVGIAATAHYDSSSFLVDNFWTDIGPRLSWNLIKIASMPQISKVSKLNEEAVAARRLAVRMAVLAQVYIANQQFRDAVAMFRQADELWVVDTRLAEIYSRQADANAASDLERISAKASAIASQLRRFETYARVQQAYGRLQQTLGRDLLPVNTEYESFEDLARHVEQRLAVWDKGDRASELQTLLIPAPVPAAPIVLGRATAPAEAEVTG